MGLPLQEELSGVLSKGVDAQGFFCSRSLKSESQFHSSRWNENPFKSSWIFPLIYKHSLKLNQLGKTKDIGKGCVEMISLWMLVQEISITLVTS